MAEQITFPNNPPQAGDQFTVGNTTFAWDATPGIWRAFTTASSSSTGGSTTVNIGDGGALGSPSTAASLALSNTGNVGAGLYYFRSNQSLSVTGATLSGQAWAMQDTGGGGQDLLLTDVVTSAGDGLSISGGNVNSIAGTITGWVRSNGTITFTGTSPRVYEVG